MSDFMSLTAVTLLDLKAALVNRKTAITRLDEEVKIATPKYKETLNLKWWHFFKKRKTSAELLRDKVNDSWWSTKEDFLYHANLLPKGVYCSRYENYGVVGTVEQLVKSGKESFHVNEKIIEFINKWKTKEA